MKTTTRAIQVSTMLFVVALLLFSCKENPFIASPGSMDNSGDFRELISIQTDNKEDLKIPNGAITASEAIRKGHELGSGNVDQATSYIVGYVSAINYDKTMEDLGLKPGKSGIAYKGFFTFSIQDKPTDYEAFVCYQVKNVNGKLFTSINDIRLGAWVVIEAQINNYGGTIETKSNGAAKIYSRTIQTPTLVGDGSLEKPFTVADAKAVCDYRNLGGTSLPNKDVYVKGYVVGVANVAVKDTIQSDKIGYTVSSSNVGHNLLIADDANATNIVDLMSVDLTSNTRNKIRKAINIQNGTKKDNMLGEMTLFKGNLGEYLGIQAITDLTYVKLSNGDEVTK